MSPTVWLYVPAMGEILQLVQLAISTGLNAVDPLMLTTFSSSMKSIHSSPLQQDPPIYVAQPWTDQLTQLGWLIIPGEGDATHLHELFTAAPAGGAFISAITPTYCRADGRGIPMPTWLLQELLNASVQFSYAPFPNGYLPPAPTPIQQLMYEALPSDNSSALDHALSDGLLAPTSFDLTPTELQELDCGYNYWGLSTITSLNGRASPRGFHPDLQWRRSKDGMWATLNKKQRDTLTRAMKKSSWWWIVMLTRAIFVGAMWVGEHPNPFEISQLEVQHRVTNIFLTALHLCDTTYDEMKKLPVTIKFTNGGTISAGWPEFCVNVHPLLPSPSPFHYSCEQLAKAFDNSKAELRKVIKGALSPHTNFCASSDALGTRVMYFMILLNLKNINDVYKAISELVREHAFLELLWASLFHPVSKLANGKGSARVADFFPEEIFSDSSCLGQKLVCNLMTLLYQSMVTIMKEKCTNSEKIDHLVPEVMNGVLMSALNEMYNYPNMFPTFTDTVQALPFIKMNNVLPIAPKSGLPRIMTDENGKRLRNMTDIEPIEITQQSIIQSCIIVPNSTKGFSSPKSLRFSSAVPPSYFSTQPIAY
ncbi:hypothetical protein F4604DRAFT_1936654 [Suillus subluteus]|nr:hypothetical protein F4604DRAFT_1936654 [Suillus subluteus]